MCVSHYVIHQFRSPILPLCVSLSLQQWEAAHHRVVGRLEENPMVEMIGGGGRGERGRDRSASLDMVDLGEWHIHVCTNNNLVNI